MRCEEVMKKDVECASTNEQVQAAARRMRDENIGFLPVCDGDRKVLGALTDRDIAVRVVAEGRPPSTRVGDVMTRESITCSPGDDITRAEELMAKNHKSRIMCLDAGGRLCGVISLSDVVTVEEAGRASDTMRQVSEREARL